MNILLCYVYIISRNEYSEYVDPGIIGPGVGARIVKNTNKKREEYGRNVCSNS